MKHVPMLQHISHETPIFNATELTLFVFFLLIIITIKYDAIADICCFFAAQIH